MLLRGGRLNKMNNRIIKFRAWDKTAKVMLSWHLFSDEIKDAIPHDAGDEWTENCELMQFTGLTDKNGKEIYEGDILRIKLKDGKEIKCDIKYQVDDTCFVCSTPNCNYSLHTEVCFDAVIIGNIFESSELLK